MAIFFTADTHFGHANVLKLSKRPFSSVEEMDESLIRNWNNTVSSEDTVYHLGDFAYRNARPPEEYLSRLNGEIHLIIGNHDEGLKEKAPEMFATVNEIAIIPVEKKKNAVLCHYPMREWPGAWRGAWHLFGHVHGNLDHNPYGFSLDVGVDSNNYRPISVPEIRAIMSERATPFTDRNAHMRF